MAWQYGIMAWKSTKKESMQSKWHHQWNENKHGIIKRSIAKSSMKEKSEKSESRKHREEKWQSISENEARNRNIEMAEMKRNKEKAKWNQWQKSERKAKKNQKYRNIIEMIKRRKRNLQHRRKAKNKIWHQMAARKAAESKHGNQSVKNDEMKWRRKSKWRKYRNDEKRHGIEMTARRM